LNTPKDNSKQYDDAEIERRREDALKRMLATPHKPHSESALPRKAKVKSRPAKPKKARA
jgi:hypothetical protein